MAARLPDPASRFPLAARALRTPLAAPPAAVVARAQAPTRHAPDNWPLYLFLFLLPLQNIQTGYLPRLGNGINFLNVMFALSLAGALACGGRLARAEPINRWILLYAAYNAISVVVGHFFVGDPGEHWVAYKDQMIPLFLAFLVQMSVNDWRGVRRVVLVTLLPLPYIAKVVWVQHASVASWHYSDDLRIKGTFSLLGANEFSSFCVTVALVLTAVFFAARASRAWRLALAGGIAAMLVGVVWGYSRTAYVALMLGVVTMLLLWRGRWKVLVPLLLAVALVPRFLPVSVVERFDSTTLEEKQRDESTELRFKYWQTAWKTFLDHPVTGTGFHTFHHREINPNQHDTHNLYMRTLSEGGVLGILVLAGLLLAVFRTAWRNLRAAPHHTWHYALALGLLGAWVALVCGNLFGDRFTYYPMIAYFWTYAALVAKARQLPADRGPG